ncbi:hypothetical protein ACJX0J_024719 [Zea mays]
MTQTNHLKNRLKVSFGVVALKVILFALLKIKHFKFYCHKEKNKGRLAFVKKRIGSETPDWFSHVRKTQDTYMGSVELNWPRLKYEYWYICRYSEIIMVIDPSVSQFLNFSTSLIFH